MPSDRASTDFGSTLRRAREQRGKTVRQVAQATKIAAVVLEALERNDISRLPGGIFGRAFVRAYATEVGLDPDRTLREFVAAFPDDAAVAGPSALPPVEDHEAVESNRQTATTFLRLILLSVPVAAIVIYVSVVGRRPASSSPPADNADARPAAVPATASALPVATPPAPPEAVRTPQAARIDTAAAAPAVVPVVAEAPAPAAAIDRLVVALSVKRPCWVSASVDGKKIIDRLVQPGDAQSLDVSRELVLTAGDGAAMALTINGAAARPIGKSGEVVTARITVANYKEYLLIR